MGLQCIRNWLWLALLGLRIFMSPLLQLLVLLVLLQFLIPCFLYYGGCQSLKEVQYLLRRCSIFGTEEHPIKTCERMPGTCA
jgi:hypothetical protein